MTATLPDDIPFLYLSQDDLYRLGNASSAKLDHIRPVDVNAYEQNGVQMIRADGRGISLRTEEGLSAFRGGGWLWKIAKGFQMPTGIALHNNRGSHYMICPVRDKSMNAYIALLNEVALRCVRIRKIS